MALDMELIVIEALLALVEREHVPLAKVSVKLLLERSGVSRQTFYNHFLDKDDLICRTYDRMIIREFDVETICDALDFRSSMLACCERMQAHGVFLRQAFALQGQNSLSQHAFTHSRDFDLAWHQERWGEEPMPDELRLATEYHAMAATSMGISWILSGFPVPAEELVDLLTSMRAMGMGKLFEGATGAGSPYAGS